MEKANTAMIKAYCAAMNMVDGMKKRAKDFVLEERGAADFIAIIIIIAIVVALCVVFKDNLVNIFNKIWKGTSDDVSKAMDTSGAKTYK